MRDVKRMPSQEGSARLVAPQARAELLDVVREAVALLSLAEVVVAGCDQPGTKGPEPARSAGRVISAFVRMAGRVRSLPVSEPLRSRIAQLLDYHAVLIEQALLMAYGEQTERTARARGSGGLGPPAIELARLAADLDRSLESTWSHPARDGGRVMVIREVSAGGVVVDGDSRPGPG
jgi:hypothetical protein